MVKGGEEGQETGGGGERSSKVRGGHPMATADIRCKEVKSRNILGSKAGKLNAIKCDPGRLR
jgi:hypothetical protein